MVIHPHFETPSPLTSMGVMGAYLVVVNGAICLLFVFRCTAKFW